MVGNEKLFCGDGVEVALPLFQTGSDGSIPISPLQLLIEEIAFETAGSLVKKWHSRLPIITNPYSAHTVCYVASFEGKYYASSVWSDPIAREYNGRNYLELRRMAIAPNAPKNTASRMISIMEKLIRKKFPNVIRLISYQDTDVHKGTIYKASGWIVDGQRKGGKDAWSSNVRKRKECQASGLKIRWKKDLLCVRSLQEFPQQKKV